MRRTRNPSVDARLKERLAQQQQLFELQTGLVEQAQLCDHGAGNIQTASLDSRVMVTARCFEALKVSGSERLPAP